MSHAHFSQNARVIAIFWLVLLSCSILPVAIFTVPMLVLTVRKFLRVRKAHRAALEAFRHEVAMASYAARAKRWT